MWGDIAIAFLLAFITAFVITPYSIRLAKKVGAVDYPNDRRVNKKPMPRLGGIAVIAGFLVSAIYLIITMRIENNIDFFTNLTEVEKVIVLGHSISEVDLKYFEILKAKLNENVIWNVSYYSELEKQAHKETLLQLGINDNNIIQIKITDLKRQP